MKKQTQKIMESIEGSIIEMRNQKVILDSDVAKIYGVETRAVNQAVQRNKDKFPKGYIISLTKKELEDLRWQNVTAKLAKTRVSPKAFTEKRLYMLATVLKSKQATIASLQIIETFAKIKEFSRVAKVLATEKDGAEQKKLIHKSGKLIGDILKPRIYQY